MSHGVKIISGRKIYDNSKQMGEYKQSQIVIKFFHNLRFAKLVIYDRLVILECIVQFLGKH